MNKSVLSLLFTSLLILTLNAQEDSASEMRTEQTIEDIGDVLHYAIPLSAGLTTILIGDKKGSWQFLKNHLCLNHADRHEKCESLDF